MPEQTDRSRFTRYGWDKDAFFYPDNRPQALLLTGFLILSALHFSELLGVADTEHLLLGFLPLHFGYHIIHAVIAILFIYAVYRSWPEEGGI